MPDPTPAEKDCKTIVGHFDAARYAAIYHAAKAFARQIEPDLNGVQAR